MDSLPACSNSRIEVSAGANGLILKRGDRPPTEYTLEQAFARLALCERAGIEIRYVEGLR